MKASDVSEIIEQEIAGNWSLSNAHGVALKRCLVVPTKRIYEDSFNQGETLELWLVLEEVPEDQSGYKIVFGEDARMFGLAVKGFGNEDVFLGFHGSFLETLEGM